MSERKEKTRALFKNGQKCLIPKFYFDTESGEEVLMFSQAQVCFNVLSPDRVTGSCFPRLELAMLKF